MISKSLFDRKSTTTNVLLGIFAGVLSVFSPGSLFFLLLCLFLIFLLNWLLPKEESRFLIKIIIFGMITRIILLLAVTFVYAYFNKWIYYPDGSRAIGFFGDSALHTVRGWWVEQYLEGKPLNQIVHNVLNNPYGHSGYLYILAFFYFLFGFSPISVTLINCAASVATGIILYYIVKEISGTPAARIACCLAIFFPSLVLWSIINLKDSVFIFLTVSAFWCFIKFLKIKRIIYLIILLTVLVLQNTIRKYTLIPSLGVFLFGLLLATKKKRDIIFLICILILLNIFFFKFDLRQFAIRLIEYHRGVISSGGFTYRIFDNWFYLPNSQAGKLTNLEISVGFLKSWFHFFLEPFPWKVSSSLSVISLPQILLWYALLPFALIGVFFNLNGNIRQSVVFIIYFFVFGSILALSGGNIGTDFRFRDLLTPIVIIFSSIGICFILKIDSKLPDITKVKP